MTDAGPLTRLDWVEARLRDQIATGVLRPGDRVLVNDLAREWQVSATPLREAVQRLAAAGLLTINPQRGARVAAVSLREATELYELRVLLEPRALRSSMENATDEYRSEVLDAFERFDALRSRQDRVSAMERFLTHRQYHDATLSRCSSDWLLRLTTLLMDQALRYAPYTRHRGEDRLNEHGVLHDYVQAGAIDDAVRCLEDHLRSSAERLALHLADLPQTATNAVSVERR
jgi:GntR family carbon starvation induced transcriptional regulator